MFPPNRVGVQVLADGTFAQVRASKSGETIVGDGHGRYQEAVYRGNVYTACNVAGIASTAGLSATSTVFTLYNPLGSGKLLVILDITVGLTAVETAELGAIMLAANHVAGQAAPATNTALAIRNALLATGAGAGLVYTTTTLPAAPLAIRILGSVQWASAVGNQIVQVKDEVAGAVILPPNTCVSIQATAACTMQCSMTWEEIPQ